MSSSNITLIGGMAIQLVAVIGLVIIALVHDGDTLTVVLPVLAALAGMGGVSTAHVLIANASANNTIRTAQAVNMQAATSSTAGTADA